MPKIRVEKIIKAERGKVFSTITDFENLPSKLGDAKDSHIVETYESVSDGTKVTVDGDFNLAGNLKLVGFLAKGKIEKSIGEVMDALAKIVS